MSKLIIIHHNDADGRCAAAIVRCSQFAQDRKVEYIEADYGMWKTGFFDDFADRMNQLYESEPELQRVFVVDFSLPEGIMLRLNKITELYWIDHHQSTKLYSYDYHQIRGLRDLNDKGLSGCELAWQYCFPKGMCTSGEFCNIPTIVKLIGDYDTWRMEHEARCKPLIVALDAYQYEPSNSIWPMLLGLEGPYEIEFSIPQQLIAAGKVMSTYRDGYAAGICKAFGFSTEFEGLDCYAANIYRIGSLAFGDRMKDYDACIAFAYDGETFTVSMYSQNPAIDCSAVCKKYNGGGHRGAAGFTCKTLPFKRLA